MTKHDARGCNASLSAVRPIAGSVLRRTFPVSIALTLAFGSGCSLDLAALRQRADSPAVDQTLGGIEGARDAGGAAGSWVPPADAGTGWFPSTELAQASDAGTASCGLAGLTCCMPGNTCESGACLRGHCTTYAGFYAQADACASSPCLVRNPYSAGCSCPTGFAATAIWHGSAACASGGMGELELSACTADADIATSFGGVWVERQTSQACKGSCSIENTSVSGCSCPPGAGELRLRVPSADPSCPSTNEALAICIDPKAARVGFGGAYVASSGATAGQRSCVVENPLTMDCTCPTGAMTQTLPIAGFELVTCSL